MQRIVYMFFFQKEKGKKGRPENRDDKLPRLSSLRV
jgi:hypothetical protein